MPHTVTLKEKLGRADPHYYTDAVCEKILLQLEQIRELKQSRNAVLLAHNYQRPEIFEVADFIGDSLGLSMQAAGVDQAEVIVFCGVHFMAETAKVVSPSKTVLLPNQHAGCSLADTAEADDVKQKIEELRELHDDLGVVCYVNTTAAVKALSDACCTSSNAVEVVSSLPNSNILFIPDQNLARHVANQLPDKNIIPWEGFCYVHHELQPDTISRIQRANPEMKVLVHPECREDVVSLADASLSTSGMVDYARQSSAMDFLAVTECGLSDLLAIEVPDKNFYRACKICRYMKMITLEDIIRSLKTNTIEITLAEEIRSAAEKSIYKMFSLTEKSSK